MIECAGACRLERWWDEALGAVTGHAAHLGGSLCLRDRGRGSSPPELEVIAHCAGRLTRTTVEWQQLPLGCTLNLQMSSVRHSYALEL